MTVRLEKFKRSAIHNLVITGVKESHMGGGISEGLVVPKGILEISDILPYEQVIVTKIDGNNWINRIKTFVVPGEMNGNVVACGSLSRFFHAGEVTCLIAHCLLNEYEYQQYISNEMPIVDVGYDPTTNRDNLASPSVDIEFFNKKVKNINHDLLNDYKMQRRNVNRFMLTSLLLNLVVNKTHPDCLQGSAELPRDVIERVDIKRYQSVTVYNSSKGGSSDTYVVPMPPQVVMTTGAMAKFAQVGEVVNVATFAISTEPIMPSIGYCQDNKYIGSVFDDSAVVNVGE